MGASGGISETVCIIEFFQGHFIAYLRVCFCSNKGKSELEEKGHSDKFSLRDVNYFFFTFTFQASKNFCPSCE